MAKTCGSQLTFKLHGLKKYVVNMSDWTNGKDSNQNGGSSQMIRPNSPDIDSDYQKRSDIVYAIIHNRSLDNLVDILGSGWDVDETLRMRNRLSPRVTQRYRLVTALGEVVRQRWVEGMNLLFEAGAKCRTSDDATNPLTLALQNAECPPDLIELLLQRGADPNHHDGQYGAIPLIQAMKSRHSQNIRIIQLLLEHKADPNVSSQSSHFALSAAVQSPKFQVILRMLLEFGADVNYRGPGGFLLLHNWSCYTFYQELLDLFFLHGGYINMGDGEHGTGLEHAVRECGHSNHIRWLIRHGADTSHVKPTLLREHFNPSSRVDIFPETPLILLQAGMRVSHGVRAQLSNMQMTISTWLEDNSLEYEDIYEESDDMWAQLEKAEDKEPQQMQYNLSISTILQYCPQQLVDLQEFSDENLNVYPQVSLEDKRKWLDDFYDQIHTVLAFLSQTQSLQWYCRRCVRENLVSLQPSVVKTLPIPARLKRYILCHEL